MFVLALDTSSPVVTVAVIGPDGVIVRCEETAPNKHGERLMPVVHESLLKAAISMSDIHAIGVGLGPGPFTGLRVGIVTAAAIADALGIPAYGMCSLDAIAAGFVDAARDVLVVTDARRRQVYWARYDATGKRLDGPAVDEPSDLAIRFDGVVSTAIGAGAAMYAESFGSYDVVGDAHADAAVIAAMAQARRLAGDPADALEPLYLRRPDAVPPAALKKVTPA